MKLCLNCFVLNAYTIYKCNSTVQPKNVCSCQHTILFSSGVCAEMHVVRMICYEECRPIPYGFSVAQTYCTFFSL